MKSTIQERQNFDQFVTKTIKAGLRNLPSHLLVVDDTNNLREKADYMFRVLRQNDLVHPTNPEDYTYCKYEFIPESPNDGLQQFYQHLFHNNGSRPHPPAVIFLDITSCYGHMETEEFRTLLSFVNNNQRSIILVFVVDNCLAKWADKIGRRIERLLPLSQIFENGELSMAM